MQRKTATITIKIKFSPFTSFAGDWRGRSTTLPPHLWGARTHNFGRRQGLYGTFRLTPLPLPLPPTLSRNRHILHICIFNTSKALASLRAPLKCAPPPWALPGGQALQVLLRGYQALRMLLPGGWLSLAGAFVRRVAKPCRCLCRVGGQALQVFL